MRILILGGTGAIGSQIIKILSQSSLNYLKITSRSKRISHQNIHYIQGNAKNFKFLKPILFEKWDVVIDLMVYSTNEFQNIVKDILSNTQHYIFFSSGRVYSDSEMPITEDSTRLLDIINDIKFLKTDEYSLSKAKQENILFNSKNRNWTIIRPYITFDDYRLQLGPFEKEEWLFRALKGNKIIFSKEMLSKRTTLTYAYDVASSIASLLLNENCYGEVFNITQNKSITWEELLNIYLKVINEHLGILPKVVLLKRDDFIKCKPSHYQIIYDRLYHRCFDCSKLKKLINTNSFHDPVDALSNSLRKFLTNQKFLKIYPKFEAVKDRFSNEFSNLSNFESMPGKIQYLLYRFIKY